MLKKRYVIIIALVCIVYIYPNILVETLSFISNSIGNGLKEDMKLNH
ncbi:hypothetical protein SM14BL09_03820 [Serratia marcescens]|nr:hypothetical protein SM14BL09_03820 [Serratia marcescens]